MIDKLLQLVAPHYCYNCAKVGSPLCSNCKYDIADEASEACLVCLRPSLVGICPACRSAYERAWYIGERDGVLQALVDDYKFQRAKGIGSSLAGLLDHRLPILPKGCVLVPVPTIAAHVRIRGYDQTYLLARELGRLRRVPVKRLLARRHQSYQRGKTRQQRFTAADAAYVCTGKLSAATTYIIIDDVVTTGATVRACASALVEAGAEHVWIAAVARQPLDK